MGRLTSDRHFLSLIRLGATALLILLLCMPVLYLLTTTFYAEDMEDLIVEFESHGTIKSDVDLMEDVAIGMVIQWVMTAVAIVVTMWATFRLVSRNYRVQKEFIENASHELQTPIAVLRTQLELLIQEDLNQHTAQLAQNMDETLTRMSHLNKSLLLLARLESRQYGQKEKLDLSHEIDRLKAKWQLILPDRIHVSGPAKRVVVEADPMLLEMLLNHLVVNAARHGCPDDCVEVVWNESEFSVSNQSDGSPLEHETLFRRFANPRQNPKGNGLGLAIVKQICDYYHWKVDYRFASADSRHVFTVKFA